MSPLLKKEIRLLLPGFLAGVVLAFSNCLLPDFGISSPYRQMLVVFPFLCCPAVVVMMALNSFGSEFSLSTFSNLLAQPVPRRRIWRIKILLLAGALAIVGVLWCLFFYLRFAPFRLPDNPQNFWEVAVFGWMFLLVVFAGGLWTVLLFRQVAAAFWFTLLVPGMIFVLTSSLTAGLTEMVAELWLVAALGLYAVAGFWLARWLFLRAQDTQWTGGTIALPEIRRLSNRFARSGMRRRWRPRSALWRKELQLHQSLLMIAAVLALVHVGVIATRKLGQFPKNSVAEFILESFWWLWLVMPLLVGCAAIAEERKMATLESQLCLPVKRWTQFRLKFLVALMISVALGAMMPWMLEGGRVLPAISFHDVVQGIAGDGRFSRMDGVAFFAVDKAGTFGVVLQCCLSALISALLPWGLFLFMAAICAGLAMIGLYGSSLSRNTLQGLAPSVLGLLLTWFLCVVASMTHEFGLGFLWRGPLFYFVATPVMTAVVVVLAYLNYQRMRITVNVWLKNLLALVIALGLVTAATAALYHRAWEWLSSSEPPPGPARFTLAHPPRMQIIDRTITVYLPDGRVWMNRFAWEPTFLGRKVILDQTFAGGKFLAGTNWTAVSDCWRDIVGVQRDGTLWVSKFPDQAYFRRPQAESKITSPAIALARFGDSHDWKNVSGRYLMPLLLKNDGTLWEWGINQWSASQEWPGLHAFIPQRIGGDSDWDDFFVNNGRTFLQKTNGQVWVEPAFSSFDAIISLPFGKSSLEIGRAPYLEGQPWTAVANFDYFGEPLLVGLRNDGTLRELAAYDLIPTTKENSKNIHTTSKHNPTFGLVGCDSQFGHETNWLAMAAGDETAITLKSDGTLWKWTFKSLDYYHHFRFATPPARTSPTRFSRYSDWVAIDRMDNGVVSLAADGSLYLWHFASPSYKYDPMQDEFLLGVSTRPILLGNIFSTSN